MKNLSPKGQKTLQALKEFQKAYQQVAELVSQADKDIDWVWEEQYDNDDCNPIFDCMKAIDVELLQEGLGLLDEEIKNIEEDPEFYGLEA